MFNQNGLLQHVMQAWVRGSERKDMQVQTVFQGDQTKDHFYHYMKDHFSWSLYSSLFLFIFSFLSVLFHHSILLLLICIYFFKGMSSTFFGTPFPSRLPSSIRHLAIHDLERKFFVFAPSVEGDPWSRLRKKNHRAQKG